nr:NAD-dependent epimerase/dehydratase family protein [Micromonospora sp. DSM 115978]
MRVVVTGGAGFVGANLCRALVAAPTGDIAGGRVDVVVLDDFSSGDPANLAGLDVEVHEGSVLDVALVDDAVRAADTVVHLAAVPSVERSLVEPRL